MSVKKGKGAKRLRVEENAVPKVSPSGSVGSCNLSAIEKNSFLEGLQPQHDYPLHSTAMEEDLNVLDEVQENKGQVGKTDIPQTAVKQRGGAAKRELAKGEEEDEKEEGKKKRTRKSMGLNGNAMPEKRGEIRRNNRAPQREGGEVRMEREESEPGATLQEGPQSSPTAKQLKKVGKNPANRRSARQTATARPVKNQQTKKGKRGKGESGSEKTRDPQSPEKSDSDTAQQRREDVLLSDEEVSDEDASWNPNPKRDKRFTLGRSRKSSSDKSSTRKSSSGSASAEAGNSGSQKRRRKRPSGTEFEVVLDAFLDFCNQYRESVESKAIKQSIDSFSDNVKEQLLEKVSTYNELRVLKRENTKVGSLMHSKTQRLLDAKYELMRAERRVWQLQNEKAELELRLADLRQGQAFLHDIRGLKRQYLDFRRKNPKEKETYGASSLPALLLEAKHIQSVEQQLRRLNKRLEKKTG